ncbi:hypothetical protein ACTWJ8_29360 [Streptomyces sp. SDT5-1]|uniref:hypothetical protein n=1 Tax=Streptomyces sp. SDT5-1 TaxID=3406418 RepID=UPI003FD1E99E
MSGGELPKVAPGLVTVADVLEHSLAAKAKAVTDLGLSLPPAHAPTHPLDALRRLIGVVEDAAHELAELVSARGSLVDVLAKLEIDPKKFGRESLEEVVTLMERWARDAASRVTEYTSVELADKGRKEAFVGYLVQHLLLTDKEISAALDAAGAVGAWAVHDLMAKGKARLKSAAGIWEDLPSGELAAPRRGENVEFWTGTAWEAATDAIWYSAFTTHAQPAVRRGVYWSQRLEIKKGHVDTKQFRVFDERVAAAEKVRWRDSITGETVEVTRERLYVNEAPEARTLMVGKLPERYKNQEIDLAKTRTHGDYIRFNGRLDLPEVTKLYDILE